MDNLGLNSSQQVALDELRRRMSTDSEQKLPDEVYTCYRFLKARGFNVDQAETMLRNSLKWRKEKWIDTIHTDFEQPKVLKNYLANLYICNTKDGAPVFYVPGGKVDVKGIFMSAKTEDIKKTFLQINDMTSKVTDQQSRKLDKRISGCVSIGDCEGLSFSTATDKSTLDIFVWFLKALQDNYPERVKDMYVINASMYFTLMFAVFKTFMGKELLNKIHIFSTEGWKEELLKVIDADDLPAFLGGNKTDPDDNPLCTTFVNHAGKIDDKHYIHKSKRSLAKCPGVEKLELTRASFSEITVQIEEPGSLIEWEFETKTRDIAFGVFYREGSGDEEQHTELVPLQRFNTDDYAEKGMYKCEKAGTYIILFDNTYSWMRSKEIYYILSVVTPKEHEANVEKYADGTSML